ncbi:xylan glycosyltransferase MUCI21-like [Rhododendron vialii]|uniref:xylan glycosyltransferase MUCI21-like n=1 Tax=Rhododendron vialii TaxID=182163 RepID=UPI0026603524|nr:xylan glycosyltransferase MUCI21-like [Rhododendron vialii]
MAPAQGRLVLVESMKKCNSSAVIVLALLFSLFLLSQIKLSSISKIFAEISTTSDQGPLLLTSRGYSPIISCDRSHGNYDTCSINGPTVLDPKTATFYTMGPTRPVVEKVRPYPQKNQTFKVEPVKTVTLTSGPSGPPCMVQHNAPALVFSVGGFTWNFFHAFIDAFIPLFITLNSISPDNPDRFVFVIADYPDWFRRRYADLLRRLSKHPVVSLDNDTRTHCFPSVTVGLISHGIMTIDPKLIPNSKTAAHFHSLVHETYCGRRRHPRRPVPATLKPKRPRLLIMGRSGGVGRVILNQGELKRAAEEEGFEVVEFESQHTTTMRVACELVSSSHAMLGVHGAALTNSLFLRPGSVLVQVVGIGLEEVAELCFGRVAKDMGLEYMEYKIGVEESSLVDRYGKDDVIVKDPSSMDKGNRYDKIMRVYLKQQNMNLDLARLRGYLKTAYEKAKIAMLKQS